MLSTTLKDNLTSDWMKAASALLPKSAAQRVLVYVEDEEDIAFWRNILNPYETCNIQFDIQLTSKTVLTKGKDAVLKMKTGTHLIGCIDSDYDYILQSTTPQSKRINEDAFVFQTYTYSIENLLCFESSLHQLCVQATKNDNKRIDLVQLLTIYSNITYELFLWSVYFSLEQNTTDFTITDFCNTVKILDKVIIAEQGKTALSGLAERVRIKIQELEKKHPETISEIKKVADKLNILGINSNNTYLFIKGHIVKDNVVLMFLNPLCRELINERENEIKNNAKTETELKNQFGHYKNQIIPIETVLKSNTDFKSCFLYQKIQADLNKYIVKL
jgi:hypothetical protein